MEKEKEESDLIVGLIEEIRLRKYSSKTKESYVGIVGDFLKSGKSLRDYLLAKSDKSRSTMRNTFFALKFFYENVLNEKFDEKIPLAKNRLKLPIVLGKSEVNQIIEVTQNTKHKLLIISI